MPPPGTGPPPPAGASSLYVGGLDARVCTELLRDVFALAGRVTLCRVVSDKHTGASMGFGFVDYPDHASALRAQKLLHGRVIYGHELTVDWAHASANAAAGRAGADRPQPAAEDISNHYCLFIGNLDAVVTDEDLRGAFSAFGACSSAQVSRDAANQSRRCAFVSFKERAAAQAAIDGLNGRVIANRPMRVDWARTKTNAATRAAAMGLPDVDALAASSADPPPDAPAHDFAAVVAQTPATFTTAYISGLAPTIDAHALTKAFDMHGTITDVRIPESARAHGGDKLYAFVVYADHEAAARAIFNAQKGLVVAGRHVTVQWGRESTRPAAPAAPPLRRPPPARAGLPMVPAAWAHAHPMAPQYPGGYAPHPQVPPHAHAQPHAHAPPQSYSAAAAGYARGGQPPRGPEQLRAARPPY